MITCDLTDDASVKNAVEKVLDTTSRIDVLVNNAGMGLLGGVEESSIDQALALFDVNLFGVMRATNAVPPAMRDQKAASIINISSVIGLTPAPFSAIYSATKHALEDYSGSLEHEVRSFGIRVCLLEPAYTRTSFEQNMALPDRTLNAYVSARAGATALMHDAMKTADDPEVVAENLIEAALAVSPRRRYTCGLAERAGSSRAREIVYTADQYDVATFGRWNIVNRVVPDEKLQSETRAFAERLPTGATRTLAAGKKIVRAYLDGGIRKADAMVDEIAPALFDSADMRAGVQALLQDGPGQFRENVVFHGR
jgi:short-subunit dehydrogenase